MDENGREDDGDDHDAGDCGEIAPLLRYDDRDVFVVSVVVVFETERPRRRRRVSTALGPSRGCATTKTVAAVFAPNVSLRFDDVDETSER